MIPYTFFIETINNYANKGQWFWVAGFARETWPVLKDHMDELHEVAKLAVEHHMEESEKDNDNVH